MDLVEDRRDLAHRPDFHKGIDVDLLREHHVENDRVVLGQTPPGPDDLRIEGQDYPATPDALAEELHTGNHRFAAEEMIQNE